MEQDKSNTEIFDALKKFSLDLVEAIKINPWFPNLILVANGLFSVIQFVGGKYFNGIMSLTCCLFMLVSAYQNLMGVRLVKECQDLLDEAKKLNA